MNDGYINCSARWLCHFIVGFPLMMMGTLVHALTASGSLTILNHLANITSAGAGVSNAPIQVIVHDSVGVTCYAPTTNSLAYGGSLVINWGGAHSSTNCSTLYDVTITALSSTEGLVHYSNTTTTPATTGSAIAYTPPTGSVSNPTLIVSGAAGLTQSSTASPTTWGASPNTTSATPTYDTTNGAVTQTGIMGAQMF